jgi:DNA-directed RNA polymerase subunit RPC12/RpoP
MKIIKKRNSPEDEIYKLRCWKCKTVFSFHRSESETIYHVTEIDEIESIAINCPVCGERIVKSLNF